MTFDSFGVRNRNSQFEDFVTFIEHETHDSWEYDGMSVELDPTVDFNNDKTFQYFSPKLVEKSSKTQLTLLRKALKILKPGKELVYSTCSVLAQENEDIVNQLLKENNAELISIDFEGKDELPLLPTKLPGTLCVCPNELYEGFFVALIKKNR